MKLLKSFSNFIFNVYKKIFKKTRSVTLSYFVPVSFAYAWSVDKENAFNRLACTCNENFRFCGFHSLLIHHHLQNLSCLNIFVLSRILPDQWIFFKYYEVTKMIFRGKLHVWCGVSHCISNRKRRGTLHTSTSYTDLYLFLY